MKKLTISFFLIILRWNILQPREVLLLSFRYYAIHNQKFSYNSSLPKLEQMQNDQISQCYRSSVASIECGINRVWHRSSVASTFNTDSLIILFATNKVRKYFEKSGLKKNKKTMTCFC